jgi:acyl-CoA dehydrogenase
VPSIRTDSVISDSFAALLGGHCTPNVVRNIEEGASAESLWGAIADSGFADALVPEALGGAGLSLSEVLPLWTLAGRFALPLAFSETTLARALLAQSGFEPPAAPVALARVWRGPDGGVRSKAVCGARSAGAVLAELDGALRLLPIQLARKQPCAFELDWTLEWPASVWEDYSTLPVRADLRLLQALVLAAQLAGALETVLERTMSWANERIQFGKPIGKFQAIQHQLALLAEEVFSARIAVQLACSSVKASERTADSDTSGLHPGFKVDPIRVAIAKARASEAALLGAQRSHAIHGAIGFTKEFDLQLFTRRLHAWREAAGSESAWHAALGKHLLDWQTPLCLDLLRNATDPDIQLIQA